MTDVQNSEELELGLSVHMTTTSLPGPTRTLRGIEIDLKLDLFATRGLVVCRGTVVLKPSSTDIQKISGLSKVV